jgi:alpha-tubulin suppressor-like RCC1 family protein
MRFRGVVAFSVSWVVVGVLAALAPVTASAAVTAPGGFSSLAPSRLLDTRSGLGAPNGAVAAGGTVALQVTGSGGVPVAGVSAVVLNVTVTQPTRAGYITVYGEGTARPTASNLNFVAGQSVPNLVIAPVGTTGKVNLYNGSAGTVHLVADVSGYYLSGAPSAEGAFGSLAPSRLLDTRSGLGAPNGAVAAGGTVALQVTGSGGVPVAGVSAVVLNVTVTQPTRAGYITVYGEGTARPTASNLNFVAGQSVPNLVIAPVGTTGKVNLYNGSAGTVHLVADVSGYYRSEPLDIDHTAYSWGDNSYGQLGDGTTANRSAPGQVGADAHWASVAAGTWHTVAVKTDGTLWAWGYNNSGQLGDGTTTDRWSPVQVGTDTHWASVAAGTWHTVAVKTDGTLWAWGYNFMGQVGDGTTFDRWSPVQVGTDTHWASVAAGDFHTLAVKTDGTLWGWGYNDRGQVGDGTTTERHGPVRVGVDTHWVSVAAGGHTVAVKTDGTVWAWGHNNSGQLGDGTTFDRWSPVQVGTDTHWASVSAGNVHTVAVRTDGTLWAWGWNYHGQLGDGTTTTQLRPVRVGTDTHWASVSAGVDHTLAVRTDGTLWAWGTNQFGQLGDGNTIERTAPVRVGADTDWVSVATGNRHTVALRS